MRARERERERERGSVDFPYISYNFLTFKLKGCYAPNGFCAEKPVICALSVDNRMLTVFKEDNGRREEIENVEVKLFETGMFVYGLHTSGHDYVTDELWAAFYKMLLEKRLVPRVVLSPESPGFYWIRNFVTPGQLILASLISISIFNLKGWGNKCWNRF